MYGNFNRIVLFSILVIHHLSTGAHHRRQKYRPPPQKSTQLQSCFREFDKKFTHEWYSDRRAGDGQLSNLMYLNMLQRVTGERGQLDDYAVSKYDLLRYLAPQLLKRRKGIPVGLSLKDRKRKRKRKRKQSRKKVRKFWENAVWKGGIG